MSDVLDMLHTLQVVIYVNSVHSMPTRATSRGYNNQSAAGMRPGHQMPRLRHHVSRRDNVARCPVTGSRQDDLNHEQDQDITSQDETTSQDVQSLVAGKMI